MSAHASSEQPQPRRALLAVLCAPLLALVNQGLLLATDPWMCVRQHRWVSFAIPLACLVLVALLGAGAYSSWRRVQHAPDVPARSAERFLALLGMALGALAATFLIAQAAGAFAFPPCST